MDQLNIRDERANRERPSSKRQVILAGRKGRTYADFIEQTTSSTVDIVASEQDPLIVSLADGFNEYGPKDYIGKITSPIANIPISNNQTNFIGLERDSNGTFSVVNTPLEPMYGSYLGSDRQNKICATFNGLNGSNTFTDFYGNIFRFYGNANISNAFPIYGGNAARFTGVSDDQCIVRPNLNTSDLEEWTIEFDIKFNTLGTLQTIFTTLGDPRGTITLYREAGNTLHLYMGNGAGSWTVLAPLTVYTNGVSATFNTTNIYNIAIVFDKILIKVYVDGYLRAHSNTLFSQNNYRLPYFDSLVLGNGPDASSNPTMYPLNGYIANFQFWPYAKYQDQPNSYLRTITATLPSGRVYVPTLTQAVADTVNSERYLKFDSATYVPFTGSEGSVKFNEFYGKKINSIWSGSDTVVQPYIDTTVTDPFGQSTGVLKRVGSVNTANNTFIPVNLNLSNWTIEFWYRAAGVGGTRQVLYTDADFSISLGLNPSNTFDLRLGIGGAWNISNPATGTNTIIANQWHHLSLNYDGSTYRFFVNGNLDISVSSLLAIYKPSSITLGHPFTSVNPSTDAWYSDFAIYPYCKYNSNYPLPTSRIQPDEFFYYDITKAKMYSGVLGNLVERKVIFIGEVVNRRGTIESVTSYSIGGKVTVLFQGLPNENSYRPPGSAYTGSYSTNLNHNIGCMDVDVNSAIKFIRTYIGYVVEEKLLNVIFYNGTDDYSEPFSVVDRNVLCVFGSVNNTIKVPNKSGGGYTSANASYPGYIMELYVERSW